MAKKKKKFKDLNEKEIDLIKKSYINRGEKPWESVASDLGKHFGVSERTIRKWVSEKLKLKEKGEKLPEDYIKAQSKELDHGKEVFMIGWAQNATKAHKVFDNMLAYADHLDAEVAIIAGLYRNVSLFHQNENDKWWDKRVLPYLSANRHNIHKYLSIMSDVKTQPTAVNPMSGMESMSKDDSCIFGHPKVHMKMIPVLNNYKPKMIMTTGAITESNYSDTKAGKKAEFHHQFGFVIVEVENDEIFHVRQIVADEKDGSFYDLYYHVKDGKVKKTNKIEAIVLGDLHSGEHDEKVLDETLKFMKRMKPEHVILHDVFDAKSISHHSKDDPFIQFGLEANGQNSLEEEVEGMMNLLGHFEKYKNVVVVRSNHDVHLDKFLKNDWRKLPTPKNSMVYMDYAKRLLQQHKDENVIGVIPELINERYPKYITLGYNDSYRVMDYEFAMHGDLGANGSRGSALQYRRLNTKIITAHTHSPSRFDSVLCTGTTTKLRLSYNKGASGWLQSHVIIHPNGKPQHVNFIGKNKRYTTFK